MRWANIKFIFYLTAAVIFVSEHIDFMYTYYD